jgi:alanyl-tRNA synthetase
MLGNFSFGDYFKEEAITFAWDFVTKVIGLPKDRLLVTIYPTDDQARQLWKKIAGFSDDKIIGHEAISGRWARPGPCGYCSEIFYDQGPSVAGGPPGSADEDGDRFLEFWNLVFMQFEQVDEKTRLDLPKPSIDTGMGLERIAAILQGRHQQLRRRPVPPSDRGVGVGQRRGQQGRGDVQPSHHRRSFARHLVSDRRWRAALQ